MGKQIFQDLTPSTAAETKQEVQHPELKSAKKIMDLYIDGMWNGNVASLREAVRLAYHDEKTG